jgi:hypothetical protein
MRGDRGPPLSHPTRPKREVTPIVTSPRIAVNALVERFGSPIPKRFAVLLIRPSPRAIFRWRVDPSKKENPGVTMRSRAAVSLTIVSMLAVVLVITHRFTEPLRADSTNVSAVVSRTDFPGGAIRGPASCSAQACHGSANQVAGPSPFSPWRSEHTRWIVSDPHSRAYQTLLDSRSVAIAEALGRHSGVVIPAHQDVRCLACHSSSTDRGEVAIASEGVGCESCHGPANQWIAPHTSQRWELLTDAQKAELGFASLHEYRDRAARCAGCHVGSAPESGAGVAYARDMNHDLVAAGHPRLAFEFGTLWARYPKHWGASAADRRWVDRHSQPDDEARIWAVGRAVGLSAALRLVADRAARSVNDAAPWPEFSDYGCFSCHFALPGSRIGDAAKPGALLGQPLFGSWFFGGLDAMDSAPAWAMPESARAAIAEVRTASVRLDSDPKGIETCSRRAAEQIDAWLVQVARAPLDVATIRRVLAAFDSRAGAAGDYDGAVQAYLGRVALVEALRQMDPAVIDRGLTESLEAEFRALSLPIGFDSPRGFRLRGEKRSP